MLKWILPCLLTTTAFAKVVTEKVVYEKDGVKMEGLLAYDTKHKAAKPGIVIFPNWMGNGAYTEMRAKKLAGEGYVAFAADVYGQGNNPKDVKGAMELSNKYKADRKLLRARAQAALDTLAAHKKVDKTKVVAIGYCFGGTTALELARSGADIRGVVSFHGGLSTDMKAKEMKPKVLALHGGDDPYVPNKEVEEFQAEMRAAKADWQFVSYGNTVHSFTEKEAGDDNSKGAAYNALSDKRSWEAFEEFLEETF